MRKFGIELELGLQRGCTRQQVSDALASAGLGGIQHGYAGHSQTDWVVKTDASVPGGLEVVSPPLDFDNADQRGQVDRALAAIKDYTKPVPSAGIHVHVESRHLSARQIAGVARTFSHFEDVLYRLASSGWRTIRPGARDFAKPLTEAQVQGLAKAKNDQQVQTAYYGRANMFGTTSHGHGARYYALNLHSHFFRGTIEFRLFNSSLNRRRVQTYIAICMAVVQDARNGHLRSVNKRGKLGAMASGEKDAAKEFHHFQAVMRYQEDGMSLDDYKNLKVLWKDSRAQQPLTTAGYR